MGPRLGPWLGLQEHGAERRRQRQRVDRRDHHRHRDRDRELPEQLARDAGNEGDRHEHREQHQRDGDDRRGDLAHGAPRRFGRRESRGPSPAVLDRLDHHDRVVDDDADREHQREQRHRVGGKPSASITAKVPISETGTAISGMRVARKLPRNRIDDDDDEDERLEQRLHHLLDALLDEDRRVVGDLVVDALGERRLQPLQRRADRPRRWRSRCRRATGRCRSPRRAAVLPAARLRRPARRARPAPRRATRTNEPSGLARSTMLLELLDRGAAGPWSGW